MNGREGYIATEISQRGGGGCVHQNHIIRVRLIAGSPEYLNAYWNSPDGNGRVMKEAASTSGLYTLSVSKVSALPIPLPPVDEQAQIVAEIERRLSVANAVEGQIIAGVQRAARLRQSSLKQAFDGKLVPQDPADEPAAMLLKRSESEETNTPRGLNGQRQGKKKADRLQAQAELFNG